MLYSQGNTYAFEGGVIRVPIQDHTNFQKKEICLLIIWPELLKFIILADFYTIHETEIKFQKVRSK